MRVNLFCSAVINKHPLCLRRPWLPRRRRFLLITAEQKRLTRILHHSHQRSHDSRARIVLTCMAGIVPYNPSAFAPSLEVRCTNAAGAGMRRSGLQSSCISTIAPGRAGAAKHRTCESSHPWRSEGGGRIASGDLQGRRKLEQRTTPWMGEIEPRREQRSRSSCRRGSISSIPGGQMH